MQKAVFDESGLKNVGQPSESENMHASPAPPPEKNPIFPHTRSAAGPGPARARRPGCGRPLDLLDRVHEVDDLPRDDRPSDLLRRQPLGDVAQLHLGAEGGGLAVC